MATWAVGIWFFATMAGSRVARSRRLFIFAMARAWVGLILLGVFYGPLSSIAAAPIVEAPSPLLIKSDLLVPDRIDASSQKIVGNGSVKSPSVKARRVFRAIITQYSRADSCHNRRDGKCIMSSGRPVYIGAVACPNFLALGTKIYVDEKEYVCEDRYAPWLDQVRRFPTVDIFVENSPSGNSVRTVSVL